MLQIQHFPQLQDGTAIFNWTVCFFFYFQNAVRNYLNDVGPTAWLATGDAVVELFVLVSKAIRSDHIFFLFFLNFLKNHLHGTLLPISEPICATGL